MTLNKQRILSELGSVVNQLQSADCGCMGKLFGNSPQNMNSFSSPFSQPGGYGQGYHSMPCHGCGCHRPYCGEPHTMNLPQQPQQPQRPMSCMGQCNAPKLYADTYNFLNENLMQPAVKEVYNDLSKISPANTIMNNEMGKTMGLTQPGFITQNQVQSNDTNMNTFNTRREMTNAQMPQLSQIEQNSQMTQNPRMAQNQQHLEGMGPQIMNMIKGDFLANPLQSYHGQGQLIEPMIIDAPHSPHGKIGLTPLSTSMTPNYNSSYSRLQPDNRIIPNQQQVYTTNIPNSNPTNLHQPNPIQQPTISPMQQTTMAQQPSYGQHTQGIKKFTEMFPGVMQGLGGDLGFDPMAIAIQMNPANQQKVAMNTMQKMMNNNQNIAKILEPSINSNANPEFNTNTIQNSKLLNDIQSAPQHLVTNQNITMNPATSEYPSQNIKQEMANQQSPHTAMPKQNQQNYNVAINQGLSQQNTQPQETQQMFDLNASGLATTPNLPTLREDLLMTQGNKPQIQSQVPQPHHEASQLMIKEPIFPVDTSKQKIYHNLHHKKYSEPAYYNTLGQPVEKLPANMYHHPIPALPQTLSPEPITNRKKYSNVKLTESKTLLVGETPTDKTPSRSQLQQIYNQYKGSQSFTQQCVKPVGGGTGSERHLNVNERVRQQNAIPVEKVGGDTAISTQHTKDQRHNINVKYNQIGDVPIENIPKADLAKPENDLPLNNRKYRNGLQDVVYTSYPTSAAWTFHGDGQPTRNCMHRGRRYNGF